MKSLRTLGVVIGRFQVHELHDGHRHLIAHARVRNDDLLVVLGSGSGLPTPRNPLSFRVREAMITGLFPNAFVLEHYDHPSDARWSENLDSLIEAAFPHHEVTLYGSRDSFLPHYSGKKRVEAVTEVYSPNGTTYREIAASHTPCTSDFRRGIIHAQVTRPPIPYPAVDIAIVREDRCEVLLGQKERDEGKWRFIGGFVDPEKDTSFERAARREAYEETSGLEAGDPVYLGSFIIDDWRYQKDTDRIMTAFFKAPYIFGAPRPSDDIDALRWTRYEDVLESLVKEHRPLGEILLSSLSS
jgi:bifunctional NMN adenylyltransferase/nudix hydrolase